MNNKKSLKALFLLVIGCIIGVTVAYFSSTTTFENIFETPEYGTTYIEKFVSPDNWLPGDETEKTLEVRNSGNVDEAVRVKVEEKWLSKNNTILPLNQGNNVAALINFINSDDWTKVTVDGENYYYYNYKLLPGKTTSKLLDKVTFNPLINSTSICVDSLENGITTRICNSNEGGYDGATYTLTLTVETVQYNKYMEVWNTGNAIVLLDEKPELIETATQYLATNTTNEKNTVYNETTKGKMFQFNHIVNGNTINESRYIGNDPQNYVQFNCDDDGTNCETWRIIGLFDVEREIDDLDNLGQKKTIIEQRIKLVRGEVLETRRIWSQNTGSYGKNDWTTADLKTFLNESYLNNLGEAEGFGLKKSARRMIEEAKYYLGSISYDFDNESYGTTEKIYNEERGNVACGACNSDMNKLTWQGYVGLMYPTDEYMVYAGGVNEECYNDPYSCRETTLVTGWILSSNKIPGSSNRSFIWFMSPEADDTSIVLSVTKNGTLYGSGNSGLYTYGVRPVVYLKSDIKIAGGTGEIGNPYKLTD